MDNADKTGVGLWVSCALIAAVAVAVMCSGCGNSPTWVIDPDSGAESDSGTESDSGVDTATDSGGLDCAWAGEIYAECAEDNGQEYDTAYSQFVTDCVESPATQEQSDCAHQCFWTVDNGAACSSLTTCIVSCNQ